MSNFTKSYAAMNFTPCSNFPHLKTNSDPVSNNIRGSSMDLIDWSRKTVTMQPFLMGQPFLLVQRDEDKRQFSG
jgi:hypothetical protein